MPDTATTAEVFRYLDQLRASCRTNMSGAVPYMIKELPVSEARAMRLHTAWIDSFDPSITPDGRAAAYDAKEPG